MPQKYVKKHPVTLLYGNGCKQHDNCFTCPFPSCQQPKRGFNTLKNAYYTFQQHNQIIALSF